MWNQHYVVVMLELEELSNLKIILEGSSSAERPADLSTIWFNGRAGDAPHIFTTLFAPCASCWSVRATVYCWYSTRAAKFHVLYLD